MSGHYRLRLTRDSALQIAEWRLAQERRKSMKRCLEQQPKKGGHLWRLVWFGLGVGALVWLAIWASRLDFVDRRVEIAIGILFVVLITAALIVWLAALTFWRSQTRSQRAGGGA